MQKKKKKIFNFYLGESSTFLINIGSRKWSKVKIMFFFFFFFFCYDGKYKKYKLYFKVKKRKREKFIR